MASSSSARLAPTTVQKVSDIFLLAGTRTWRRSDGDRIEREAGMAAEPGARIEGGRIGDASGHGR